MSRAKALSDLVAALPVGAFDGPEAEDPHLLGAALFGAQTQVEWVVIADGVGTWKSTWVAVVPTTEGLVGIATEAPEADQENWAECSPGQRVDMVLAAAHGPVVGPCPDRVSFAAACVDRIPTHVCASRCLPDQPHALFEPYQDPSFSAATWLLRALLADQSAAQVEAVFTLLALTCEPGKVATARTELEALAHLCTNWRDVKSAERLVHAVAAGMGWTLSAITMEDEDFVPPVLCSPRFQWAERARQVLAAASGDLDWHESQTRLRQNPSGPSATGRSMSA